MKDYRFNYILIALTVGGREYVEYCSDSKKKLESYIKQKGYYFSAKHEKYINDKNDDLDYVIEKLEMI